MVAVPPPAREIGKGTEMTVFGWVLLWVSLGCSGDGRPATSGSVSAKLAARSGELAIRARDVASRAADLSGKFDAMNDDPNGDHTAEMAAIRAEAAALSELAIEIEAEARAIGASAQVF